MLSFMNLVLVLPFLSYFVAFMHFVRFSTLFSFICSLFVVVDIVRGSSLDIGELLRWEMLLEQAHGNWKAQDARKWILQVLALALSSRALMKMGC